MGRMKNIRRVLGVILSSGMSCTALISAQAGTPGASHLPSNPSVPFSIPVPCTDSARGVAERIDQRKCSEVLTQSDKSGLLDRVLEKDRRIRECKYLGYTVNVDLMKSDRCGPGQSCTDQQFCEASGKKNYKKAKSVVCDWGLGEKQRNHLGEHCGTPGTQGNGKWEYAIKLGIEVAVRRVVAERLVKEIQSNQALQVTSARCAVPALDYRDQILVSGKELNDAVQKGESSFDRKNISQVERLCRDGAADRSGGGQSQAACFISAARSGGEAVFGLVAGCEIKARSQLLLAQIQDDLGPSFREKVEYCASRRGRKEQKRENGVRGAKNQFDACYEEVYEDFVKRIYQRFLSQAGTRRNPVEGSDLPSSIPAALSWVTLISFVTRPRRRFWKGAIQVLTLAVLPACDKCAEKNCLQTRAQELNGLELSRGINDAVAFYNDERFEKRRNAADKNNKGTVSTEEFIGLSGDGFANDTETRNDNQLYEDKEIGAALQSDDEISEKFGSHAVGACCTSSNTKNATKITKIKEAQKDFTDHPAAYKYCFGEDDGQPPGEEQDTEVGTTFSGAALDALSDAKRLSGVSSAGGADTGSDAPSGEFANQGAQSAASADQGPGDKSDRRKTALSAVAPGGARSVGGNGALGGSGGQSGLISPNLRTEDASAGGAAPTSAAATLGDASATYSRGGAGAPPSVGAGGGIGDGFGSGLLGETAETEESLTQFGTSGADGASAMGTEDPDDYFMRTRLDENLFKKIEKKLREKEPVLIPASGA